MSDAKQRSKKRGIPFDLDVTWLVDQVKRQNYRCKRSGMPLQLTCPDTGTTGNAFAPSLDRRDNSLGYTKDNVDVVCYMYNTAKNRFTDEDLYDFCKSFIEEYEVSD